MANVTVQLSVDSVLQDDTSFEQQLIRVCRGSAAARQALRMALQDSEELLPDESGKVLCGPGDEAMNPGTAYAPCNQNGQLSHSDAQETAEVRRLEQENHTLQEKVKELRGEKDRLESEAQTLRQERDRQTLANTALSQDKLSLQDQVKKLSDEKDRLESDARTLRQELDRQTHTNNALLQDKLALQDQVQELRGERGRLESAAQTLRQEHDRQMHANTALSQDKLALQDQVQELHSEKDRLEKDAQTLRQKNDCLEKKYRVYQCLEEAWENYQALSEETRRRLDGLFKQCRTSLELLAFGSQEKESTLTSLWEQCRSSHMANGSEFANLKVLFEFFLSMNLAVDGHNGYQRLEAKEGSAYAPDQGMQAINPMSQGQVSTVILAGFKETRTGKIIRKCLVEVS